MNKFKKQFNSGSSLMPEDDDAEVLRRPKNQREFARIQERMKRLRREAIEDRDDW